MREILTIGRYFRKKFGFNVYKIPVSMPGFTCPNIDGTVAKGGCVYCENESFSPNLKQKTSKKFFLNPKSSSNPLLEIQLKEIDKQYEKTKVKLKKKFNAKKFLIYFQSFTNTYAPFETLKTLYEHALSKEDVIGISIGTRTDSVDDRILGYLKELSKTKEVWVEYGIQSFFNQTMEITNRGHNVENVIETIKKTKEEFGLKVCGHLIFGLPGENEEMMLESVKKAVELKIDSLKIHPLYVVKNTALAVDYMKGRFIPIEEEQYISILIKALKIIPENVIIQRVTAGIRDDTLLAPKWCYCKHEQMKHIKEALKKENMFY